MFKIMYDYYTCIKTYNNLITINYIYMYIN